MKASDFDVALFRNYLKEKKNLADSSVHYYVQGASRFLKRDPNLESLESYNTFIIDKGIRKRSGQYYSILKAFIEYKISDGNLRNKLLDGLIRPPERRDIKVERKFLNEDKILDVINNMTNEKHRIVALIQSLTGVRAGDVLRLGRGNIQSEKYENKQASLRLVLLGKGSKRNVVYLHDRVAISLLLTWIQNNYLHDEYYFLGTINRWGKEMQHRDFFQLYNYNYKQYWMDLKQALNKSGIAPQDFATHDMRRCFARRVWEKYKDIHVLQSMLNHSDPKVTLKYLEQSGLKNVDYHYEMQTN